MWYQKIIKPILDFAVAFSLLILLFPVMLLLTLLLIIANKGKVFFIQKRPGLHGNVFKLIKFKTMTDQKDGNGKLLPDNKRQTVVGKWIRKLSLDEIPQLINVLKGDMSLIGPRPLLVDYLYLYNDFQKRRHEVKPGITGWAQVNGRNAISWQQKFRYDVEYVEKQSFWLDLKIMGMTISKVLRQENVNASTTITMEAFKGN